MDAQPVRLLDRLKSATWDRHKSFEQLPFVTSLVDCTLPLESYVGQLRGLAVILSALEQALAQSLDPAIVRVRPLLKSRFDMLCADLAFFSDRLVPDIFPSVRIALDIARTIRADSCNSPGKLLGYLYVVEGTTRGNQVHLPDVVRCLDLKSLDGASFYRGYGTDTDSHWLEFSAVMNSVGDDAAEEAMLGTLEIYDALERFHQALYPIADGAKGFTATMLNPEAGDHQVPQNPVIIQAALRAGRRCRDEFSYFERRYGERGLRFTDSDAAWLASLADHPQAVIADQVLWLGRVLSARGMPMLLMERQLELLIEELRQPEIALNTEMLESAADGLRSKRLAIAGQSRFDALCTKLAELMPVVAADFTDLPLMLAAAQIDRLSGMPECLESLVSWLKSSSLLNGELIESAIAILSELAATKLEP